MCPFHVYKFWNLQKYICRNPQKHTHLHTHTHTRTHTRTHPSVGGVVWVAYIQSKPALQSLTLRDPQDPLQTIRRMNVMRT